MIETNQNDSQEMSGKKDDPIEVDKDDPIEIDSDKSERTAASSKPEEVQKVQEVEEVKDVSSIGGSSSNKRRRAFLKPKKVNKKKVESK